MAGTSSLIIRKNHRFEVSLPGRLAVMPESKHAVRLTGGDASGVRWLEVDVVDLSSQGVGVMSPLFLPRGCRVDLRVHLPGVVSFDDEPALATVAATVRRVTMTDRRPAYLIGCSLGQADEKSLAKIRDLLIALETGQSPEMPSVDEILGMRERSRASRAVIVDEDATGGADA